MRRSLGIAALAGLLLATTAALDAPVLRTRAPEPPESADYPSDWFGLQRAYPGIAIPQERYLAALEEARIQRLPSGVATRSGSEIAAGLLQWLPAGPYNIGGRVTALAVVPGGRTVYLGAAAGGVFKSDNFGINWTPVFDPVSVYSIGALALDPTNVNNVYAGTGESNAAIDNYDGSGLYRSTDAGVTWGYLGLKQTARIARVVVDPQNPARLFVAAMGSQFSTGPDRGLYVSSDGGVTWAQRLFVNDSTGATDVVLNPAHPETAFCATWERVRRPTYRRAAGPGSGIWRSTDHGVTWTRLSSGLPAPSDQVGRIGLAVAPTRPSTIYAQIVAGAAASYSGLGLYRSTDGGNTWARRDVSGFTGNFSTFGWYFGDFVVDPLNADRVYSLGLGLSRSTDGGATFSGIGGVPHPDEHALWLDALNPGRIYLGGDGGFFSSVDDGGSWFKSVNLPISQFYAGDVDAANPARLVGGTQDNNTLLTSSGPSGWSPILGGDGFYCLVDPTNPNVILAEFQNCSGGSGPQRSTSGGSSFVSPLGIISSDRFNWCTPFVMDPSNHNIVLVGSQRVYKSTNNGANYSVISGDLTTNPGAALVYGTITTLAISPVASLTYYAGTDDGRVWRTIDGGVNWTEITAGLARRWVTRVTPDAASATTVYVTLSGFTQDEKGAHVYRSTDRGDHWSAIDAGLPDAPVNDLIVDPVDPTRLFVATDFGVYASRNLGLTWFPLGQGLPLVPVNDLTLHTASRTLIAATHGRSQWTLDLTQLPVAVDGAAPIGPLSFAPPSPNPSRDRVHLTLESTGRSAFEMAIYDASGRRVRTLDRGTLEPGRREFVWDGTDSRGSSTGPGVYFARVSTEGSALTRRIIRTR